MADTEAPVATPPKEKKKKRSVKSSEKSKVTNAAPVDPADLADSSAPQQNGDASLCSDPTSNAESTAPAELDDEGAPNSSRKVSVDAMGIESDIASQGESTPRPKLSVSEETEDVPSDEMPKVPVSTPMPSKKSLTPEVQQNQPRQKREEKKKLTEVNEDKMRELAEAFLLLDFNQDGFIDKKDLQLTYATLGRPDIPDTEIQTMLDEAKSPLDFEAFVNLLGYKTIELDPEETLLQALGQWDIEGTGLIPEQRIRHDLMTWGDKFTLQEVDWALEDAPLYAEQDGNRTMIDYVEFVKVLCGLRKT